MSEATVQDGVGMGSVQECPLVYNMIEDRYGLSSNESDIVPLCSAVPQKVPLIRRTKEIASETVSTVQIACRSRRPERPEA